MRNYKSVKTFIRKTINMLAGCISNVHKTVVFEYSTSFYYSCNLRAITEKMHELYPDYKLIWGLKDGWQTKEQTIPDYVTVFSIHSLRYIKERASAIAFVKNEAMSKNLYKNRGQLFIQTWHGDRGIKKILYDSLKARGLPCELYDFSDNLLTDLFVIGSDYAAKRIKTAFNYKGRTLKYGCPRNDCLLNPKNTEKVRSKLRIKANQKVLLYAPTLRRYSKIVKGTLDIYDTLTHFSQRDGKEWICLVRAHPKSLGLQVNIDNDSIIDVSCYPDMADLLMVADALITDYSSCAGDFILRKKPLILAQFDLEQYLEEDRTFYVDINETGFLIAKTQEELNRYIDTMTDEQFAENCEEIMKFFGTYETGRAAEAVCEAIDEHFHALNQ